MRLSILSRQPSTLVAVEVLSPRTLDEALRIKAERAEAVPIQGGTDVMFTSTSTAAARRRC